MSLKGRNHQTLPKWALGLAVLLLSEKVFLCTGNCLPGVLISALLNIWRPRLRRQQTVYFCLLRWLFLSQRSNGCLRLNMCGTDVETFWLNSLRAAVCTHKFESQMALKWSCWSLGYGGNDDHFRSSSKVWLTEQMIASLSVLDFYSNPSVWHVTWMKTFLVLSCSVLLFFPLVFLVVMVYTFFF